MLAGRELQGEAPVLIDGDEVRIRQHQDPGNHFDVYIAKDHVWTRRAKQVRARAFAERAQVERLLARGREDIVRGRVLVDEFDRGPLQDGQHLRGEAQVQLLQGGARLRESRDLGHVLGVDDEGHGAIAEDAPAHLTLGADRSGAEEHQGGARKPGTGSRPSQCCPHEASPRRDRR